MIPYENELEQLLTEVETLLQEQKAAEALPLLDRARILDPRHGWVTLFRGVALGQLGQAEESVAQLITAADENPQDIDIQVDAARHLSLQDYHQDALVCARRAVALDEMDAGAQAVFGEVLERLGRIAEAVPAREAALSMDPEDTDSRYYLAVDLCDLGRYTEAETVAAPLFSEFTTDPDIIRLHGACLSYLGRHHDALGKWAALERLEGISPNLLHNRASTLDALGKHDEALGTIDEAIGLEPDMAMNYYTRGMINERRGDYAAAIDDYLAALELNPDYLDAVINLVELTAATEAAARVAPIIEKLLEKEPTSAKLLYARGRLRMESGDIEGGEAALQEAIRCEPALGVTWYALAALYGMSERYEEAVTAADRALIEFGDDYMLWLNRGQALHALKRYPEAMASYDTATTLAPDDPAAWFHLGRLLLLDLERPADARGVLAEAARLQPDNENIQWMLALSLLRLNRYDECAEQLRLLLAQAPTHIWGRLVRAALSAQQGEIDAAFADLDIAARQGYDPHLLINEPLFEPLWLDPRFADVVRKHGKGHKQRRKRASNPAPKAE
jgi:tetratricopeptide (TPR) repeat protein